MNHSSNNNNGVHFLSYYFFFSSSFFGIYAYYHYVDYCMDRAKCMKRTNEYFQALWCLELHCVTIITNFQDGYSWCTLIPVWHTILIFFFFCIHSFFSFHRKMPFVLSRARDIAHAHYTDYSPKRKKKELRLSHPYNIGTIYLKVCNNTKYNTRNEMLT